MAERHAVVIGGGISGLSAAYHLRQLAKASNLPLRITVVEREKWWGGKIRTVREGGFVVEGGPDAFVTVKPWALELCRELGLEHRLLPTNPKARRVFILWRNRLRLLPHGFLTFSPDLKGLLMTDLLSLQGKLRVMWGILLPQRQWGDDVSIGAFLRYYMGAEMSERIIAPLIAGVYGGSIDNLSARMTLPTLWHLAHQYRNLAWASLLRQGVRRWLRPLGIGASDRNPDRPHNSFFLTLQGGLGELVETLLAHLKDATLLSGRTVVRVEVDAVDGQRYALTLDDGERVFADALVFALPAADAAQLLRSLDNGLASELAEIPHNHAITVSFAFDRSQVRHPLNGSGFLVAPEDQRERLLLACTWTSSKFPPRAPQGKALLRAFVNRWTPMSEREIAEAVLEELRPLLGIVGEPERVWVFRWASSMPQYVVGHAQRVRRIRERLSRWASLALAGNYLTGIGIPDCIRSGREAAQKVWQSLIRQR